MLTILVPKRAIDRFSRTFGGSELHLGLQQHGVPPGGQGWRLGVLLSIDLTWRLNTHTHMNLTTAYMHTKIHRLI